MRYPLLLEPRPVARVWGGRRLEREFGRKLPEGPVGESWELYGGLPILNGRWSGKVLDDVVREMGRELVGKAVDPSAGFPLLFKWLDCNSWLSVQVHPDDTLARSLTGNPKARGKTECWYFYRCDEDAVYIHGFKAGIDLPAVRQAGSKAIIEALHRRKAVEGVFCLTEAGTVHALGPGLMLYEIQQSSDLTYRLYDWDRVGLDGNKRPLHIEESWEAILKSRPTRPNGEPQGVVGKPEVVTSYFLVESFPSGSYSWETAEDSFEVITALDGAAEVIYGGEKMVISPGACVLIPAGRERLEVYFNKGRGGLRTRVPVFV